MNIRDLLMKLQGQPLDAEVFIRRRDGGLAYLDVEEVETPSEYEGLVFQHVKTAAIEQIDDVLQEVKSTVHDLNVLASKLKSLR